MDNQGKRKLVIFFLLPGISLYSLFFVYPMAKAFYISLYKWRGISLKKTFIGLSNFKELIFDRLIWMSLLHNFYILAISLILILTISLFFTIILTRTIKRPQFYRIVYFCPTVLSSVIVAIIWAFIYNPSFGILNAFLSLLGLGSATRTWLGDPNTALIAVTIPQVWQFIGFYMVFFLAGVQNIPDSFYDSAKIDGASEWQSFWHITVPLLWEPIKVAIVFIIIRSLRTFELVFLMTRGGPNRHTEVMTTYLYEQAFTFNRFGYATSIGILLFVIMFGVSYLSIRLMRKEVVEY